MKRPTPGSKRHGNASPASGALPWPDKDYTADVIEFLKETHGNVRRDAEGDFYYNSVSTISLHFLLRSKLPAQEVLWRWYLHFDRGRSESIYRTLPPQDDEQFLAVLETCSFRWNAETVRESGLVFLHQHRAEVYLALEEFLSMRMDAYRTMSDAELREALTPRLTWSEAHLRKLIRRIQVQPLSRDQRHALYGLFESDYVRATARHLLDDAAAEPFWKSPPPELEELQARFTAFGRMLTETSRRLGVHVSRDAFERMNGRGFRGEYGDYAGAYRAGGGSDKGAGSGHPTRTVVESQLAVLGLVPGATLHEVRSAYREMVKRHHPDQGGAVQDFLRLQEAYEFLITRVF